MRKHDSEERKKEDKDDDEEEHQPQEHFLENAVFICTYEGEACGDLNERCNFASDKGGVAAICGRAVKVGGAFTPARAHLVHLLHHPCGGTLAALATLVVMQICHPGANLELHYTHNTFGL